MIEEKNKKQVGLFQGKEIRKIWDDEHEKWYFSVVDVVAALEASSDPRKYWNKLVQRLREEGSEVVTKCHQLKFLAKDGKYYLTDAADTETIFRIPHSPHFLRDELKTRFFCIYGGKIDFLS